MNYIFIGLLNVTIFIGWLTIPEDDRGSLEKETHNNR